MEEEIDREKKLQNNKVKSVSLALSGGGARGAIHLGVLKAFDENNIKIDAVSGTSIGAIIGALYCAGNSPDYIKTFTNTKSFKKIFAFSLNNKGLLKMDKMIKLLSTLIPENDFDKLKTPFYSCVSNLDEGTFEILENGDLYKSIVASASIPIVFEPVTIKGKSYIDGGLFNNLPVDPLINKKCKIIGVHVNNYKPSEKENMLSSAERIFTQIIKSNVKPQLKKCDYIIEPYISKHIGVLNFNKTDLLFEIGYKEAKKLIKESLI
ncbi:MAG: patatin-like phospholipase family protein [Bacteroidota bacterium]